MEKRKCSYLNDTQEYMQNMWLQLWFIPFTRVFN